MCVWGQCSKNATKGEAGSTCQVQNDCQPDLCCAIHKGTTQHTMHKSVTVYDLSEKEKNKTLPVLQPCYSPFVRSSRLNVNAVLMSPTTWWSCCPGTRRIRNPGNTVRVPESFSASTSGECSTIFLTVCDRDGILRIIFILSCSFLTVWQAWLHVPESRGHKWRGLDRLSVLRNWLHSLDKAWLNLHSPKQHEAFFHCLFASLIQSCKVTKLI